MLCLKPVSALSLENLQKAAECDFFTGRAFYLAAFYCFVWLSEETASASSLRYLKKGEECNLSTLRIFVFDLKVGWKPFSYIFLMVPTNFPFSKTLPTTNFGFIQVWTLCLDFSENGFNFAAQNFAKSFRTFVFDLKVISKLLKLKLFLGSSLASWPEQVNTKYTTSTNSLHNLY